VFRVGVQFDKPATAVQASLDRFVFGLIRRKAEAKRPIADASQPPGAERRVAPRVEIGEAEGLEVALLPTAPRGALSVQKVSVAPTCRVADLSTTGCAFLSDDGTLKPGGRLRLRLKGRDVDVELGAKIVHVSAT
jgi:hypothetical protein